MTRIYKGCGFEPRHPRHFRILALAVSLLALSCGRNPDPAPPSNDAPDKERVEREILDRATIEWLIKSGADPTQAHLLEHHFIADDRQEAEVLARELKSRGYGLSEILESDPKDGVRDWSFDASKPGDLNPRAISAVTWNLILLARKHGCRYDGWGALLEK